MQVARVGRHRSCGDVTLRQRAILGSRRPSFLVFPRLLILRSDWPTARHSEKTWNLNSGGNVGKTYVLKAL